MTAKIFRSIFLLTLAIQLASFLIFGIAVKTIIDEKLKAELKKEATYISEGIEIGGESFLRRLDAETRITWIDADGKVLFDTDAAAEQMGNHASREEITAAFRTGSGFEIRRSDTLLSGSNTAYYALRLEDNTVIRVASDAYSVATLLLTAWQPIVLTVLVTTLIALLLALSLSRSIVRPINRIDLSHPEKSQVYPELRPIIGRLIAQNRQAARQMETLTLRQNEFDTITANMNEGMIILNANAEILSCNRSAATLLGAGGSMPRSVLSLPDSASFREAVRLALTGQNGYATLQRGDASYSILAAPVRHNHDIAGAILMILDETEKESRERLRREFTANVSHELKTPLTSISGFAELIKNNMTDPDSTRRFAERIYREAQRLIVLVGDIIRLSQLDDGEIPFDQRPIDLLELAHETQERLEGIAAAQKITVRITGENMTVRGNRQILTEMLYNLLDNAIKYNRPGGEAEILLSCINGQKCITVRDNGIGIPPEDQPRIFERFFRVDKSHSKEIGGTGLGLSIVKHGAAFHHAQITLESQPDVGTQITLCFEDSVV